MNWFTSRHWRRMIKQPRKADKYHGCYEKSEDQLSWLQYYEIIRHEFTLWGLSWVVGKKRDRPMHKLINRAFG